MLRILQTPRSWQSKPSTPDLE